MVAFWDKSKDPNQVQSKVVQLPHPNPILTSGTISSGVRRQGRLTGLNGGGGSTGLPPQNPILTQARHQKWLNQLQKQQPFQHPMASFSSMASFSVPSPWGGMPDWLRDVRRNIHSETGPAIKLDDGKVVYVWHGVRVPGWVVENPEQITLDKILAEQNVELRRVLIERFGKGRFLKELGGEKMAEDECGILWKVARRKFSRLEPEDWVHPLLAKHPIFKDPARIDPSLWELFGKNQTAQFVEVKDTSTERHYFLPVPTKMKRPKQAIAWTFGLKEEEYKPLQEA